LGVHLTWSQGRQVGSRELVERMTKGGTMANRSMVKSADAVGQLLVILGVLVIVAGVAGGVAAAIAGHSALREASLSGADASPLFGVLVGAGGILAGISFLWFGYCLRMLVAIESRGLVVGAGLASGVPFGAFQADDRVSGIS
jgi:hypothetical protein